MTNRLVPLVAAVAWCSTAFGSVNLNPGDDIQAAIDNNPEGTTFFLNSGVYRLSTGLTPKSFDIFIGQAGTVLNGSRLLTSWTQEDTRWVIQTPTQHAPVTTLRCSPSSYTGCLYDDAVFYDDQPLWRVMTKDELGPGKVYIDSANDRVYLADDPQDRKVEMATSARALISAKTGVVSVTIQGLIIEKFANAGGEAALEAGADWTILRCSFFCQNFSESFFLDPIIAGEVALPVRPVEEPFVDGKANLAPVSLRSDARPV